MSLQPLNSVPAISSLEIAKLTDKRHDNVMADIKSTLDLANIPALKFQGCYEGGNGKTLPCYYLPKFECDLVVSGYSVPYRAAIIKRWHELEAEKQQPAQQIPSHAESLRLAADYLDQLEAAKLELADATVKLAEAEPKSEFYDTVTASATVVDMAIAAHTAKLPFGRNTLYQKLREMGVLISSGQRYNLPKQRYIEQGLFTVNESKVKHNSGETELKFTTYVTQKGIAWLITKFKKEENAA